MSEEIDDEIIIESGGEYSVVFDPLDGSSNIDCGVSIGTIYGIYKKEKTEAPSVSNVLKVCRASPCLRPALLQTPLNHAYLIPSQCGASAAAYCTASMAAQARHVHSQLRAVSAICVSEHTIACIRCNAEPPCWCCSVGGSL